MAQVEYSMQGEVAKAEPNRFAPQKFTGHYVNAMVYLKWFFHQGNMKRDMFLFAGPKVDYLVLSKKDVPADYDAAYYKYNLDNTVKKFGYGVSVGTGFALSHQFEAYLRYDRGFSKVYTDNPRNTYNRLLAVGINYYLNENWW
ncbi:outer membrane beta-barrel protein [uncultured Chryseobacterium sp.]|uniref:outer membrane beta-barrel protein n=1 Tax=uncultured Chryseobacterium sp. TaxID=259322 RepID=UPI002606CA8F|nr:outer membrane beta-barrel protein [uncultured Chryseobacterium sp.]